MSLGFGRVLTIIVCLTICTVQSGCGNRSENPNAESNGRKKSEVESAGIQPESHQNGIVKDNNPLAVPSNDPHSDEASRAVGPTTVARATNLINFKNFPLIDDAANADRSYRVVSFETNADEETVRNYLLHEFKSRGWRPVATRRVRRQLITYRNSSRNDIRVQLENSPTNDNRTHVKVGSSEIEETKPLPVLDSAYDLFHQPENELVYTVDTNSDVALQAMEQLLSERGFRIKRVTAFTFTTIAAKYQGMTILSNIRTAKNEETNVAIFNRGDAIVANLPKLKPATPIARYDDTADEQTMSYVSTASIEQLTKFCKTEFSKAGWTFHLPIEDNIPTGLTYLGFIYNGASLNVELTPVGEGKVAAIYRAGLLPHDFPLPAQHDEFAYEVYNGHAYFRCNDGVAEIVEFYRNGLSPPLWTVDGDSTQTAPNSANLYFRRTADNKRYSLKIVNNGERTTVEMRPTLF